MARSSFRTSHSFRSQRGQEHMHQQRKEKENRNAAIMWKRRLNQVKKGGDVEAIKEAELHVKKWEDRGYS